jgi:hypothetical protein
MQRIINKKVNVLSIDFMFNFLATKVKNNFKTLPLSEKPGCAFPLFLCENLWVPGGEKLFH